MIHFAIFSSHESPLCIEHIILILHDYFIMMKPFYFHLDIDKGNQIAN